MKGIIFGLGSIGQRHARILLNNFNCELFAYRSGRNKPVNDLGLKEVYAWQEVEKLKPQFAFVTNPTYLHIETALYCARLGMHLFIEKPVSNSMRDIDLLESICREKKLSCYTAYCLRFHPVIKKVRELIRNKNIYHVRVVCSSYLPHWREGQDFKKSYSVFAEQGGGVLLELSHEFDYLQYLFGRIKDIKGVHDRLSNLTVDCEDFADVWIKTDNSVCINLHINFISLLNTRRIVVDFEEGYLIADLIGCNIEYFYKGTKEMFNLNTRRDEYLKEQFNYFFSSIDNPLMMNALEESKYLLSRILEFKVG